MDIHPHPRHRSGHGRTSSAVLGSAGADLRPDKPPRGASGHQPRQSTPDGSTAHMV